MYIKWKAIENIIEGLLDLNNELFNDTKICFKKYKGNREELQRIQNKNPLNKPTLKNCGFDLEDIKSLKKLSGKIITQIGKSY